MKKITFCLLTLVAFSSLILAKEVSAASCSGFTAKVDGSAVTLTGANCSPDGRYLIHIIQDKKVLEAFETQTINGKNEAIYYASQEGNYEAKLIFLPDFVMETSFSIEPINITPLKCGDPCNSNDNNCPSQCPSTYINGQWLCYLYQAPTSPLKPTSPPKGETRPEEKIDFNALGKAIPSLGLVFQPGPATNIGSIISLIIPYLFVAAGLLLFIYLIIGGLQMMTSAGDEKALTEAKGKITNGLIGFLLLFVSFWLVQIIGFVLGIKIF